MALNFFCLSPTRVRGPMCSHDMKRAPNTECALVRTGRESLERRGIKRTLDDIVRSEGHLTVDG